MHILLVEDNPADVYLLQEGLASAADEHTVQVASSVAEAATILAESRPDGVLLDLSLPDSFGLETLAAIQALAPDLPVIILSGNADQQQALDAVRNGAQDFLMKGDTDGDKLLRIMRYAIERARVKADLRRSQLRYRRLYDSVPVGLFQASSAGDVLSVNSMLVRMLGFESEREVLRAVQAGSVFADPSQFTRAINKLYDHPVLENFEIDLFQRNGAILTLLVHAAAVRDESSSEFVVEGTAVDITERKLTESQLRMNAERDELTGLVNRRAFRAIVEDAIDIAKGGLSKSRPAVLLFDLDGFKTVNDSLGHAAGDELLREVSQRVMSALRQGDTLARIGGDEFAVHCEVADSSRLAPVADKILAALAAPFDLADEVSIGASVGVALFPEHGNHYEALLAAADGAMYTAKRGGKNRCALAEKAPARTA